MEAFLMKKNFRDVGLILSLIFILTIGGYWLIHYHKQEKFDQYIGLLGEKLLAMVPESSEKRTLERMFKNIEQKVEDKQVAPEQIEQIAADIMNITNITDSVSIEEAEAILSIAEVPAGQGAEEQINKLKPALPVKPIDEKRWQEMRDRIKSVYLFHENLNDRIKELSIESNVMYHAKEDLHIVMDSKLKSDSLLIADSMLKKELDLLEEEKILIWHNNFEIDLQKKLKKLEEKLEKDELQNLNRIKIKEYLQIIESVDGLDSLLMKAQIDLDSIVIPEIEIIIDQIE
jgi:hypothetical protein